MQTPPRPGRQSRDLSALKRSTKAEAASRGPSPGAPNGDKNAFKHGRYSAEALVRRRAVRELLGVAQHWADT